MIDLRIWEDVEGKPGHVRPVRNCTPNEIDRALLEALPEDVLKMFDYTTTVYGMPGDTPIPDFEEPVVDWKPGANEGYFVYLSVLDEDRKRVPIWYAKTFDPDYAIRLHLELMKLIWGQDQSILGALDDALEKTEH